ARCAAARLVVPSFNPAGGGKPLPYTLEPTPSPPCPSVGAALRPPASFRRRATRFAAAGASGGLRGQNGDSRRRAAPVPPRARRRNPSSNLTASPRGLFRWTRRAGSTAALAPPTAERRHPE